MQDRWIADRMGRIEISGVRRVFELARKLKDPVNLSIGQPHFDVPAPIKEAAKAAIDRGANGYTTTQGIPDLRDRILRDLTTRYRHPDRDVIITSGTSGGLLLSLLACVNPGDEVIVFDPYFVAYPHMITLAGGTMVTVDTHPTFAIDPEAVRAAISPRTKAILLNSPSNPSGVVVPPATLRALTELCTRTGVLLISDEIYHAFSYDTPFVSPAAFSDEVLVVDGFGKTYGMTGWRMGFAHGPRRLIDEMAKLQQFTYVCAPSMAQHAAVAAWEYDVAPIVADYQRKRDLMCAGLRDRFEFEVPGGAFYLYPRAPQGNGMAFVEAAIQRNLLVIPGSTFSRHNTHFRISYAASDSTLERGIEILNQMAVSRL